MTNLTIFRLLLPDRRWPSFGKAGLFAGLLAVLTVLAPLQIMAQGSGLDKATKRLFQAVYDNNLPTVQVTITDGADIKATDESGRTPVDIAVDEGFFDIAHFLLSVRNIRSSQPSVDTGPAAGGTPTVRTSKTAPKPPAPLVKKVSKAATAPAPPPVPVWPKGKPNPFDPGAVSVTLPILGDVQGKVRGNPPPKAVATVATVPPPEPQPSLKPKPKTSLKILEPMKEVAETPPSPPMPSPPMPALALKPDQGLKHLKQKASPPPPSENEAPNATGAPPAVSKRPGGAQNDASSVKRLMNKVSTAIKQEARTGEARRGSGIKNSVRAGNVEAKPSSGFLEKTSNFFRGLFGGTSTRPPAKTSEGPKPVEDNDGKLVVRNVKPAAKEAARKSNRADAGNAPQQAAITEGKAPTAPLRRYLTGITLTLGRSVRLGVAQFAQGGAQSKPCIKKKNGALVFCIEDVDWPNWIKPYFQVNSIIYQGVKAIVRYDNGAATSYHVIFPTGSYPTVVQYYTTKFGKPTKTLNRSIAPLAAPRRENQTTIWQSINTVTKQVATLEVREFDDARGTFPDTKRGAVMLYQQGSSPIFPKLSTMELMILNAGERAHG